MAIVASVASPLQDNVRLSIGALPQALPTLMPREYGCAKVIDTRDAT